jgi:hypothetical protein
MLAILHAGAVQGQKKTAARIRAKYRLAQSFEWLVASCRWQSTARHHYHRFAAASGNHLHSILSVGWNLVGTLKLWLLR